MATRYVSKHASASDSNGGTNLTTDAWATALKGFTSISGGDTLVFGTGTYDIDRSSVYTPIPNGSSGNPTIITDAGDGVVTFNHPGVGNVGFMYFTGRSPLPNYITIEATSVGNIVFDMEGQTSKGGGLYFGNNNPSTSHDITIKNIQIKNTADSCIYGGETGSLTIDSCILGDQVSGGSGGGGHCVYASGPDLIINGCTIRHIRQNGIHCNPGNRTGRVFSNNLIYSTGESGPTEQGNGIMLVNGSAAIYNNVIHTTPNGTAMFIWRPSAATIYHNTVHGGGSAHSSPGIDVNNGSGMASNVLIKNNIIIGYSGAPVAIRTNASNAVVTWNRCDAAISNASGSTTASDNATDGVATDEWVDPTNATLASRDYNLKAGADSIAPGAPSVGVTVDIDGDARNFIDQGAYAYGSTTPPDPPIIGHDGSYTVTHEFTDITLTVTKGTNNVVEATVSTTGKASLSAVPTDVTVLRNT